MNYSRNFKYFSKHLGNIRVKNILHFSIVHNWFNLWASSVSPSNLFPSPPLAVMTCIGQRTFKMVIFGLIRVTQNACKKFSGGKF